MTTTDGNKALSSAISLRPTKLKAVMDRWHQALVDIRESLLSANRRRRIDARRRDRRAPKAQLTQVSGERPEPVGAGPPTPDADSRERELVPLPDERSQALAVLCDRLLHELDSPGVNAAEIRFVVHKHERPGYPQLHPGSEADAGDGELLLELRRLIAWSGEAVAEVAQTLETRGVDLDNDARELLRDELEALDVDLATLNAFLADPVDWDSELQCLLAGEVAPFDDLAGDEDDENND